MTPEQAARRATIKSTIALILEIEPDRVRDDDRLREDLGMDSLGSLELLSTLSEKLRIELEIEDAMDIRTVDDACVFVERRYLAEHGSGAAAHA